MEEFKSLSLGEIKNKVESTQNLFLVSVNYDKKGGIRLEKDIEPSKLDTILEEVKNFYKLYIFNEEFMMTIFNFGNEEYRYNKVKKSDFDNRKYKIYLYERIWKIKSKNWKHRGKRNHSVYFF